MANLDLSDLEKLPLERFNQIQLWVALGSTIPGKVHAKIEKRLLTSFGCTILTFLRLALFRRLMLPPTTTDESAFEKLRCQVAQRS